jgi:hypothetical protein
LNVLKIDRGSNVFSVLCFGFIQRHGITERPSLEQSIIPRGEKNASGMVADKIGY